MVVPLQMFPCLPFRTWLHLLWVISTVHLPAWEHISQVVQYKLTPKILHWIKNCVDLSKVNIRKKTLILLFHPLSFVWMPFLVTTSLCWKVGHVFPPLPHLVMPLTVEPSKPRLCNDNHFLNLWIKDKPFHLASITGLPLYFTPSSFQS